MQASVQDGQFSEPFPVTNGVKQGCVVGPTLFNILLCLSDAYRDHDIGVGIRCRNDDNLFNLRRLQARTIAQEDTIRELLFADDSALNAAAQSEMQESMDLFSDACNNFGFTISTKKTEVMCQHAPHALYTEPSILPKGQRLAVADKFVYLENTISRSITIDEEVSYRIAKASSVFGRLRDSVWNPREISLQNKLKVHRAVALPSLLYASETWTVYG